MSKAYFINKRMSNQWKNNIDRQLHEAFVVFDNNLISDQNLEVLDRKFEEVVAGYLQNKGRAAIPTYKRWVPKYIDKDNILVTVSESLEYELILIAGQIQ